MNNFGLTGARPSIDLTDVNSVKEMIFNRAREKSASLAQEKGDNVTQSVQNDVMTQARASISNNRRPFGILTRGTSENKNVEDNIVMNEGVRASNVSQTPEVQPQHVESQVQQEPLQLKHNIQSVDNSVYTASMRDETMRAARNQFSRRRASLEETLRFLNTQAAITMVNKTHSKIV